MCVQGGQLHDKSIFSYANLKIRNEKLKKKDRRKF